MNSNTQQYTGHVANAYIRRRKTLTSHVECVLLPYKEYMQIQRLNSQELHPKRNSGAPSYDLYQSARFHLHFPTYANTTRVWLIIISTHINVYIAHMYHIWVYIYILKGMIRSSQLSSIYIVCDSILNSNRRRLSAQTQ